MKVFFLAVTGGGGNIARAQSDCPPGYTLKETQIELWGGNQGIVKFCVNCSANTYFDTTYIKIVMESIDLPATMPLEERDSAIRVIYNQIYQPSFVFEWMCRNGIEPCQSEYTGREVKINHFFCWRVKHTNSYFGLLDHYEPCDTSQYCQESYRCCYNPGSGTYTEIPPNSRTKTVHNLDKISCKATRLSDVVIPEVFDVYSECCYMEWYCFVD